MIGVKEKRELSLRTLRVSPVYSQSWRSSYLSNTTKYHYGLRTTFKRKENFILEIRLSQIPVFLSFVFYKYNVMIPFVTPLGEDRGVKLRTWLIKHLLYHGISPTTISHWTSCHKVNTFHNNGGSRYSLWSFTVKWELCLSM